MYCLGGPLDMLCILMLLNTLIVPVRIADVELNGFTSEQGLARKRIGAHDDAA